MKSFISKLFKIRYARSASTQHNLCSARMADESGLGDPCVKCTNNACVYRRWIKSN